MSIKAIPLFIKVQIAFLIALGIVVGIGDQSQPKITQVPQVVSVNQPLVVSFDRPMNKEVVEKSLKLLRGEEAIKGVFTWSSRSLAFTPNEPLSYDTSYTLVLDGIQDAEGSSLRKPYRTTIKTSSARFVYVTPDFELRLHNLDSKMTVDLSDSGHKVLDYSVSSDGMWLLASYQSRGDTSRFGVFSIKFDGSSSGVRRVLYEGSESMYTNVELCGANTTAVIAKSDIAPDKTFANRGLVSVSLSESGFDFSSQKTLLSEKEVPSTDSFKCSNSTDQLLYQSQLGSVVIGSMAQPSGDVVGAYTFAFGFSPKATKALLGDYASPTLPANRINYSIDEKGLREKISDEAIDSFRPSYDPTEQIIAQAEAVEDPDNEFGISSTSKIVLRQRERATVYVRSLSEGSTEFSDDHPSWSADGRFLTFERVDREYGYDRSRPRNNLGELVDGDILLIKIRPGSNLLASDISIENPELKGSSVTWLP